MMPKIEGGNDTRRESMRTNTPTYVLAKKKTGSPIADGQGRKE